MWWRINMAVTLVLEDGTGLTNSTSYVSIAEFKAYWTQNGVDYTSETDDTIALWVNSGSTFADSYFCYGGIIANMDQALEVPRTGWYDSRGNSIDNSVPTQLKNAVCEFAGIRQATRDTTETTGIKSKSAGPISVTYSSGSIGERVKYTSANKYMRGLLCANSGMMALPR